MRSLAPPLENHTRAGVCKRPRNTRPVKAGRRERRKPPLRACAVTLAPQRVTFATYFRPFSRIHRYFITHRYRRGCPVVALQCRVLQTTAAGLLLRTAKHAKRTWYHPYSPECVGGRLAEEFSVFLLFGLFCVASPIGLACGADQGDPRGSSVARTITPAPGLLLPPRRSKGCRAPINFEPQFGQFTPANALPEAMFHQITPWSPVWMASCHAKSSN